MSQEQAKMKSARLPDGEKETVNRLQSKVKKARPKTYERKDKHNTAKKKGCEKCGIYKCTGSDSCFAKGKSYKACKKTGHFAASKLCSKKSNTSRKIQTDSGGSGSDSDDTLCRVITEAKGKGKEKNVSKAGKGKHDMSKAAKEKSDVSKGGSIS